MIPDEERSDFPFGHRCRGRQRQEGVKASRTLAGTAARVEAQGQFQRDKYIGPTRLCNT